MSYIEMISRRRAHGEAAAVYRYLDEVSGKGPTPNIMKVFSLRPATMRGVIETWELSMWMGGASRVHRELLAAMVSRLNQCLY